MKIDDLLSHMDPVGIGDFQCVVDALKEKGYEVVKLGAFDEVMYEHYIVPVYVKERL